MTKYIISGTVELTPVDEAPPVAQINPEDILVAASADTPFAEQSNYTAQTINKYIGAADIPEAGIHGTALPNGDTLRVGKVSDPATAGRKALLLQAHRLDPMTSGGIRSELSCKKNIEWNKVYWCAVSCYVYDWGTLSEDDEALFACQMHSGDDGGGPWSPSFSVYTKGTGREFAIRARYANTDPADPDDTVSKWFENRPIAFGKWVDWVFKFKHSLTGFLQVWMDSQQIVNYTGKLGFHTPTNDYAKFGYYNWTEEDMNNTVRKVLLRNPSVVRDNGYTWEQVRGLLA